ncbi:MAG: TadE/TadG family type IV pilus assembly protein [Acetobacteraceae bacterium]
MAGLEFALVAPVLLALSTGAIGLCLVIRARTDLAQAAQSMAQLIAAQSTVTPAQIADFCVGASDELTPFSTTTLQLSIASVTNTGGTVATDWNDTSCGNGTAIADPATLAAATVPSSGDSTIVVQASYTYQNPLSLVLPTVFDLTAIAYARPRANTTVTYN